MRKAIMATIVLAVGIMVMATGVVISAAAPEGAVTDPSAGKAGGAVLQQALATNTGASTPKDKIKEQYEQDPGVVKDPATGLIWLKDANCFGQLLYDEATSMVSLLKSGVCGLRDGSIQGDWRLPTEMEIRGMSINLLKSFTGLQFDYWVPMTAVDAQGGISATPPPPPPLPDGIAGGKTVMRNFTGGVVGQRPDRCRAGTEHYTTCRAAVWPVRTGP